MLAPGTVVSNRYRVIQPLGEGGMKAVYLAEDLRFKQRRCALALMVDSFVSDDARRQAVARFEREADVLSQLDHPCIPKVSDRFNENNSHYFVMDYVEGQTLEQKLSAAGGRLGQWQAIDLALQICGAFDYLHTRVPPVIYRDLKPSNVIVTAVGKVKLVDFGIARHFTRQGTNIGTVGYAAPEQYQGICDRRSDVYALGATLHQMLSGRDPARFPFEFPSLTELLPGCDPELEKLVGDALKRNPAERLPNAGEFARRLELIARPKTEEIREPNERIDNAGMQYCRQCSSAVPTDSRRCPACGAGLPAFSTAFSMPKAAEPTAASVTVRLCAQCRREIPNDARVCPYCAAVLATQWPSGRQARSSSSGGRAVIAIVAVTLVIGAGLVARSLWESAGAIPWPLWILAGVLLLVLEVHYTQDFTLFCFGVSALIVGVLSIFGVFDIWAQWISFAAISVALLFSARNWLRRKTATQPGDSELENITGQIVIPLEDLPAYGFGKAELRGTNWSAHNATNTKILRGQRCMVMQIKGLTLWIMPE